MEHLSGKGALSFKKGKKKKKGHGDFEQKDVLEI